LRRRWGELVSDHTENRRQDSKSRRLSWTQRFGFFSIAITFPRLLWQGLSKKCTARSRDRRALPNAVDFVVDYYRGKTMDSDKGHRNFITGVRNAPRNQAKHASDPAETEFEVARLHPASMIMRAVPMIEPLGGSRKASRKARFI
jgi:hypothetical protein